MKKQWAVNSVVYFASFVAACLLNLLISWLLVKIVILLVAPGFFALAVVRVVSGVLSSAVVIGAMSYYDAYRKVAFPVGFFCAAFVSASVLHFLWATLFRYYPFAAGGVRYLAGILAQGSGFTSFSGVDDIRLVFYMLAFWLEKLPVLAVGIVCGFLGRRKRLTNRRSIEGYPTDGK